MPKGFKLESKGGKNFKQMVKDAWNKAKESFEEEETPEEEEELDTEEKRRGKKVSDSFLKDRFL